MCDVDTGHVDGVSINEADSEAEGLCVAHEKIRSRMALGQNDECAIASTEHGVGDARTGIADHEPRPLHIAHLVMKAHGFRVEHLAALSLHDRDDRVRVDRMSLAFSAETSAREVDQMM